MENYRYFYKGFMCNSEESLPLGNGDLGVNFWIEKDAVYLLLSKTDSWSEIHRLLKTGLIKIEFTKNILTDDIEFCLDVYNGIITAKSDDIQLMVWVDAHNPIYHIECESRHDVEVRARIVNYRDKKIRVLNTDHSNYHFMHQKEGDVFDFDCIENKDSIFSLGDNSIGQYHRNETSCYDFTLKHQGLSEYPQKKDPFMHRTFGFLLFADNFIVQGDSIQSLSPQKKVFLHIVSLTMQCDELAVWKQKIKSLQESIVSDISQHKNYWNKMWDDRYIFASGSDKIKTIQDGYILQRFMNISAGRGRYPIKFNGSIFTSIPSEFSTDGINYDYRKWGGLYWFQNTRLIYWSTLLAGDYELTMPFFNFYLDTLDFIKYKTKEYYGYDGAAFPETITVFGCYGNTNYGAQRKNRHKSFVENKYIRYLFSSGLEIAYMMLRFFESTRDEDFFTNRAVPFIIEILKFYLHRFDVIDGKMRIHPSMSLETWQDCVDDTPTIAGLKAVSHSVLSLSIQHDELTAMCRTIQDIVPDIPYEEKDGVIVIAPCRLKIDTVRRNVENPELYTVFPFGLFCTGAENLDIARNTYFLRDPKISNGWEQNAIHAALLGLTEEVEAELYSNYTNTHKNAQFQAFWGPNFDWTPDQDNGGVANTAYILSLVQEDENSIFLLPAWNKKYDVSFRLPLRDNNFVEVVFKKGLFEKIEFDKATTKNIIR